MGWHPLAESFSITDLIVFWGSKRQGNNIGTPQRRNLWTTEKANRILNLEVPITARSKRRIGRFLLESLPTAAGDQLRSQCQSGSPKRPRHQRASRNKSAPSQPRMLPQNRCSVFIGLLGYDTQKAVCSNCHDRIFGWYAFLLLLSQDCRTRI